MKEKKPRIDKYLLKDEQVVFRPKMTAAAGIPHLLLSVFGLLLALFFIYWMLCMCIDYNLVSNLSEKAYREGNYDLHEQLGIKYGSLKDSLLTDPSTLSFFIKFKCLKFDIDCLSIIAPIGFFCFMFIRELIWALRGFTREAVVTNKRILLFDTAFIHDYFLDFKLERVTEIISKKGFIGKIFNYGEIFIGTGNDTIGLAGYTYPVQTVKTIEELVEKAQNKNHR